MIALRPLGATGLSVSRLGVGLAALGRPGYINVGHSDDFAVAHDVASMRERTWAVLDAAWTDGARYFDAARSYGRAEEFLGGWLQARRIDPAAVTIGSKWGYTYTANWNIQADKHEVKEHSLAVLQRQLAESQALLGTHLDLYQIHSATLESGVLDNRPVWHELTRLRSTGVRIGLSLSGPNQAETLRQAMAIVVDGHRLFDCVQATWNVLELSAGPALAEAHAAGMGVIVKEALANGRLTERNHDPGFADKRRWLQQRAAERRTTIDALALAAVLAQPWADVVLSGAAHVDHWRSNAAALAVDLGNLSVTASELAQLAEAPGTYWTIRGQLPWN
jgi:aryl-alcohol dehydrogenase-like predicted oxidoreductase